MCAPWWCRRDVYALPLLLLQRMPGAGTPGWRQDTLKCPSYTGISGYRTIQVFIVVPTPMQTRMHAL